MWLSTATPATRDKIDAGFDVPAIAADIDMIHPSKRPPATAAGSGRAGPYSGEAGTLTYLEICEKVADGWTSVPDPSAKIGPYAYSGEQWVGYDDPDMAAEKTRYAVGRGLGGVMVWDVGSEDVRGVCGGGRWPLLAAINANLDTAGEGTTSGVTGRPVTTSKPVTTARPTATFTCPSEGTFADPEDCTSFYVCAAPKKSRCPAGTAFSRWSGTCRSDVTGCRARTTAATSTTRRPTKLFSCPRRNGLYADPYSCRWYFSCLDGKATTRACPAGTGWDKRISSCNWDYVIDCFD
ncbi:probable chitinase 10 [Pollicipes pollicipes]|uniref:probable chitinase 10 n=1 Tax=Pollicipes pollicipes TaxID=41117 RepID=UPI00188592FF|nr:probable chitinase 10 [Pollicipes pollicipes]